MARLRLRETPGGAPRTIELPGGELFVGREDACHVVILERSISRRHARLVETEAGWCVYDEGSGNGTFVNGQRVRDALLTGGDEVRFGMVSGWFEDAPQRADPPPPPPPARPPAAPHPPLPPPARLVLRASGQPAPPPRARRARPPRAARRRSALPVVLVLLALGLPLFGISAYLLWQGSVTCKNWTWWATRLPMSPLWQGSPTCEICT